MGIGALEKQRAVIDTEFAPIILLVPFKDMRFVSCAKEHKYSCSLHNMMESAKKVILEVKMAFALWVFEKLCTEVNNYYDGQIRTSLNKTEVKLRQNT